MARPAAQEASACMLLFHRYVMMHAGCELPCALVFGGHARFLTAPEGLHAIAAVLHACTGAQPYKCVHHLRSRVRRDEICQGEQAQPDLHKPRENKHTSQGRHQPREEGGRSALRRTKKPRRRYFPSRTAVLVTPVDSVQRHSP